MKMIAKGLAKMTISVIISSPIALANDRVSIYNTGVYNLRSDQPRVTIELHYPGAHISSLCGVEIRADSSGRHQEIGNLFDAIMITPVFAEQRIPKAVLKGTMTVSIDLSYAADQYMTAFNIETKSGNSLSQVIDETLGQKRSVVLVGTSCN